MVGLYYESQTFGWKSLISTKKPRKENLRGLRVRYVNILERKLFSHPDFTVDPGISPDPAIAARGLSPPIGNWERTPSPCPEGTYAVNREYSRAGSGCQW